MIELAKAVYDQCAALRGAATLKVRLQKEYGGTTVALAEERCEGNQSNAALHFVSNGGELLKRTRKGKQMAFLR